MPGIDFFAQELKLQEFFNGLSSFSCFPRYPLSEPTESDGDPCSRIMALVQFLPSPEEQISVVQVKL